LTAGARGLNGVANKIPDELPDHPWISVKPHVVRSATAAP
jgi:hypothetical protein